MAFEGLLTCHCWWLLVSITQALLLVAADTADTAGTANRLLLLLLVAADTAGTAGGCWYPVGTCDAAGGCWYCGWRGGGEKLMCQFYRW